MSLRVVYSEVQLAGAIASRTRSMPPWAAPSLLSRSIRITIDLAWGRSARLRPAAGGRRGSAPPGIEYQYRSPAAASTSSVPAGGGQRALAARLFSCPGSFALTRFSRTAAFPPEVCPGPVQPARGIHKRRRTSCLARLLQNLRAHSAHPRGCHLPGGSEGKTGRKRILPRHEKTKKRRAETRESGEV